MMFSSLIHFRAPHESLSSILPGLQQEPTFMRFALAQIKAKRAFTSASGCSSGTKWPESEIIADFTS